jgi:putative peptidoglycan lipid II flippase
MAANVLFDLLLYRPLAVGGLALATSLAGMVNFFLLLYLLVRRHGHLDDGTLLRSTARIVLSAAVMGGVVLLVSPLLMPSDPRPIAPQILHVGGSIGAGLLAYLAMARLVCRSELADVRRALLRRRRLR